MSEFGEDQPWWSIEKDRNRFTETHGEAGGLGKGCWSLEGVSEFPEACDQ